MLFRQLACPSWVARTPAHRRYPLFGIPRLSLMDVRTYIAGSGSSLDAGVTVQQKTCIGRDSHGLYVIRPPTFMKGVSPRPYVGLLGRPE